MKDNKITAEEMEQLFDEGDMRYLEYFDLESAHRPDLEKESVKIELPAWMVDSLDKEAERSKISRQSVIMHLLESYLRKASV